MDYLRISLLGSVRIFHDQSLEEVKLTPTIQILLAYLLLSERRLHSRDVLAEQFWSNQSQEKARGCLNTALWRLRRALEPDGIPTGTYLLTTRQGEVGFNHDSPYWLDVAAFKSTVNGLTSKPVTEALPEDIRHLEDVLSLYQGDLLEGSYEDWTLREREHLRIIYLGTQAYLMRYYHIQTLYEKGLHYGKKILEMDPLREEVYRDMMRMYAENGQRTSAVRLYEECSKTLEKELGIAPMLETQQLYQQIIGAKHLPDLPALGPDAGEPIEKALQNFKAALEAFNRVEQHLDLAIQLIQEMAERQKKQA